MTTFRNLSPKQSEVFEQIAVGNDAGHNPRTLDALWRKNLIERTEQSVKGTLFVVYRYHVPLPIHREWCEWCSQQEVSE